MAAAFAAGFVDAIVGGGGLIQLPALFAAYPAVPPAQLLGTNKLGSICGTGSAVLRYMRAVRIPWRALLPGIAIAFSASIAGASLVNSVSPALFRPLVPAMLVAVLIYVLWNKHLGSTHAPIALSRRRSAGALFGIAAIGFYDGFFGPGTGSFLMVLFIRLYGFDFLHASAGARTINVATNAGAVVCFGIHGEIHVALGLALGICKRVRQHPWNPDRVETRCEVRAGYFHRSGDRVDRENRRRRHQALTALPMSRMPAPPVALANPAIGNPVPPRARPFPVTGYPFVAIINPVPVPGQPDIVGVRCRRNGLHERRRRGDHHHPIDGVSLIGRDAALGQEKPEYYAGEGSPRPLRLVHDRTNMNRPTSRDSRIPAQTRVRHRSVV